MEQQPQQPSKSSVPQQPAPPITINTTNTKTTTSTTKQQPISSVKLPMSTAKTLPNNPKTEMLPVTNYSQLKMQSQTRIPLKNGNNNTTFLLQNQLRSQKMKQPQSKNSNQALSKSQEAAKTLVELKTLMSSPTQSAAPPPAPPQQQQQQQQQKQQLATTSSLQQPVPFSSLLQSKTSNVRQGFVQKVHSQQKTQSSSQKMMMSNNNSFFPSPTLSHQQIHSQSQNLSVKK